MPIHDDVPASVLHSAAVGGFDEDVLGPHKAFITVPAKKMTRFTISTHKAHVNTNSAS